MMTENAIIVRNAIKRYGTENVVLGGLDLTVPRGCIYSLLGASGCGKTTLLSCIVGTRKLDSGDIWVLGGKAGNEKSGIPGPRVGYMPQDISLVDEFSTIGALYFFGRINGMDDETIEDRYTFLKDLLQLPPRDRLVKNMSGGQQRRISFAAAMLHKPELLVLDEPTVGLDPVLRDNIWNYLVKITQEEDITIIITTHYIEEAKQANKIGLLRCGQLLAEATPNELLEQWQTDSLEEAFLKLSELQSQGQTQGINRFPSNDMDNVITVNSIQRSYTFKIMNETTQKLIKLKRNYGRKVSGKIRRNESLFQSKTQLRSSSKRRCYALLVKNALQFIRYPGGVLFSLVLPILQVTFFLNSIGGDPKSLRMLVVNEEAGNCHSGINVGNVIYNRNDFSCHFVDLSCMFLSQIEDSFLEKVYYDSYDDALANAKLEKCAAIMHFKRNHSYALQAKMDDYLSVPEADLVASQIDILIVTPDRQISLFLQKKLYDKFFDMYESVMDVCRVNPKYVDIPLRFEDPIFGSKDQKYGSFVTPSFIMTMVFTLATSISSSIIITDRHSGVWDRLLVQGVTTSEILITHLITQVTIIIIQTIVSLCFTFLVFDVECKGSMTTVAWLTLLEGICGMLYGFMISVVCNSHALVNYAAVGSFYPLILLCGLLWPVEGMPRILRWFSLILPLTRPGISLRSILIKGMSINQPEVYSGFLVLIAWIVCFVIFCLFHLKLKST